jgi:hypothetical protein
MSRLRICGLLRASSSLPVAAVLMILVFAALGIGVVSSAEKTSTPARVPLVALIVNPDRYDGAEIEVTAWGVIEYEMAALFLSESDYRHLVFENGVRLEVSETPGVPASARGYLSVVGRFRSGDEARGFAGRMSDIRRITEQQYQHSPQQ